MGRSSLRLGLLAAAAGVAAATVDHCTAFAASPGASADGAARVGQTADGEGGPGGSVIFVPAEDHPAGSRRPVLDQATGVEIGRVPQVPHTYAYTYNTHGYGMMNEHKLAFGESTCSARITAKSLADNGTALFSNKELTLLALERCRTARCAVRLMGDLAESRGGFYGEDFGVDSGGETLLVADPTEAWVFHILADPTGRSAIWAAQRVADGEVAFVPNTYIIRAMQLTNKEYFAISSNALAIAKQLGFWDGQSTFDFARAFSLGEYNNPHYSSRRLWRAYNLLRPSWHLDPALEITPTQSAYPFSVKPDKPLTTADIVRVYRDYYEGTEFSLVADTVAAGPFNSPLRVAGGAEEDRVPTGMWERPISIYRADYAVVNVCPPNGSGIVWFAPHTPHASVFAPAWTSSATAVPRPFAVDESLSVDRKSMFWAASAVSNWAYGTMFSKAIVDVRAGQKRLEERAAEFAKALEGPSAEEQTSKIAGFAADVHAAWWDLFWTLMGKYNDGYVVTHEKGSGKPTAQAVGYPAWWLNATHFEKGASINSVQALKKRMADAAALMKRIDANRTYPPLVAARAEFVV